MKKIFLLTTAVIILAITVLAGCQASVSPMEDTRWLLVSYGEPGNLKNVIPDAEPTARFDSETKEVKGNGGCNTYFGSYEVDGNNLTMTGPFAVTEMWCGDEKGALESEYLDILLAAESFKVDGDSLVIYCGENVLNFECEQGARLEDIKWELLSYGEPDNLKNVLPGAAPTARFDSGTKEVSGNAGINDYGGKYQLNGNQLTFEGIFHTQLGGNAKVEEQEEEYVTMLSTAESFEVDGNSLVIYCGDAVLNYERE